ncbi:hypothetical protein [Paenibacillus piscarius]|uniref:hypothetical protein n=1 Tax=Paenibacillus piscarius TaxID=1089681 RepID=UPI001EE7D0CE|nr:hypothetical protein [Paenibacillus piscarius]
MSLSSKIIEQIRIQVIDYESYASMAESKQNEVNGLKSLKKSKSIDYQLREAQDFLIQFETRANTSRIAALRLSEAFKEDFDSTERVEVKELTDKLK